MSGVAILEQPEPLVLGDLVSGSFARSVALVGGAACLVGVLAQISIHLSFTPVPITGQTLGVLVVGTALGWRRGTLAMSIYALGGLAGVPWFAGHTSGYVGVSFGYILGFIVAAALCGYLAEHKADRTWRTSVPAMISGEVVIYVIGVFWLAMSLHIGVAKAVTLGLSPFIIGDALKTILAAGLLPSAWKLVGASHGDS